MDRTQLIDEIMAARTPEEIAAAQSHADSYLAEHPDDLGVTAALEQLAMMRFATS